MSQLITEQATTDAECVDIAALFRVHGPTVARWAARLGGPSVEVEDVVQEVFMVASRRLQRFDANASITTWLFRATERVVYAARRKSRLRRRFGLLPPSLASLFVTALPGPADSLVRQEVSQAIYCILDRLPESQRKALILFQMEGLSTDEIAQLLDVKCATVRVWLHRGRARFIQLYEEHWQTETRTYEKESS